MGARFDNAYEETKHLAEAEVRARMALGLSLGRTYHLCDPPTPDRRVVRRAGAATGRRVHRVPLPEHLTRTALHRIPGASTLLGIPAELLDYFVHPTHYLSDHTQSDLEGTEISCPPFASYAHHIVSFMQTHPGISDRPVIWADRE